MRGTVARLVPGALLGLLAAGGCSAPSPGPPNVLLLVVDTLRADHLGAYGYPRGTSPALDRLAAEGALMEVAIAPSSWSPPSHTTLVTGRDPQHHHVLEWGHGIAGGTATLASHLRRRGYATALFSSHLSLARGVGRFGEGFDVTVVMDNEKDAEVLRGAADWIRETPEPWFLQVVLMTPHAPYTKYPARFDAGLFTDVPPRGEREFPFVESRFVGDGGIPTSVALESRHDAGYYLNRYDRSIRQVDRLVRRFLDSVGVTGAGPAASSTLLVVASDHGESFGEKDSFSHELHLYDHLVRVPLLFRWPGSIPAGVRWSEPVGLVDVVPTVLALAGAGPSPTDGVDLSGLLTHDRPPPPDRSLTGSYVTGGYRRFMVRRDGYKLVWDAVASRAELYDLERDPGETENLLERPADDDDAGAGDVFESLHEDLSAQLAAYAAAIPALTRIRLPEDVREELRALGYVD